MRILLVLVMLSFAGPSRAEQPVQSLDAIRDAARRFVAAHQGGADDTRGIRVGRLDSRLRLKPCGAALEASFLAGGRQSGNKTVRVVCPGPKPWSLYVPVSIRRFDKVVVLDRPVEPGALLGSEDVRLEEREIGHLASGYFTDPGQVVGKKMRRSLGVGQPVSRLAVTSPRLLRRGDRVMFLARAQGLEVRMEGEMLSDGAAGDRVRVRNLRSNRVVEGKLDPDGTVIISMGWAPAGT